MLQPYDINTPNLIWRCIFRVVSAPMEPVASRLASRENLLVMWWPSKILCILQKAKWDINFSCLSSKIQIVCFHPFCWNSSCLPSTALVLYPTFDLPQRFHLAFSNNPFHFCLSKLSRGHAIRLPMILIVWVPSASNVRSITPDLVLIYFWIMCLTVTSYLSTLWSFEANSNSRFLELG